MNMNSSSVIIETLKESVDIEGSLAFVEGLLNKHTWDYKRKKIILDDLNLIRRKQHDTHLYLAVVGEFSSGKSTFINALIRDDLLKRDVLQATTAANTIIQYNDMLDVEVEFKNGTIETFNNNLSFGKRLWRRFVTPRQEKMKDEVREYIYRVTADDDIAKTIQNVKILHPSNAIRNGLVIIDTPGTNVNNERHESVTKNAIKELSDAAIIIIPADVPVSQSMIDFIGNNLKDVINRCIFIVTKMDLIRSKERERIMEYVRQRLKTAFDIENVNVFSFSPLLVLKDAEDYTSIDVNNSMEDFRALVDSSYKTEKIVYKILEEQKIIIQLQKLVTLINSMFEYLQADLELLEKSYKERHAALEKNRIKDLTLFVKEEKKRCKDIILDKSVPIQVDISRLLYETKDNLIEQVRSRVYNASKEQEIKKFVKRQLDGLVTSTQADLPSKLSILFEKLQTIGLKQKTEFETEFKKLYISLATLGGNISINENKLGNEATTVISNTFSKEVASVKGIVKSDNNKEVLTSLGGAGACAAIGTVIMPGIGTAIGFVIGSFAGWLFKKPLEEQQKKYFDEISKTIEESFAKSMENISQLTQDVIKGIVKDMDNLIESYSTRYDTLVKNMIRRDEEEKQVLMRKSLIINEDLVHLTNRKCVLEGIHSKISGI